MKELDEPIHLCSYDEQWPKLYTLEAQRMAEELPADVVIEHIGSTAVPGLLAKPIIDMMIGMEPHHNHQRVRSVLVTIGYEDMGKAGVPGGCTFDAERRLLSMPRWLCTGGLFGWPISL